MTYVLQFFYPTASATAHGQRLKFFRAELSATAEGENCAYGPTLNYYMMQFEKKMSKKMKVHLLIFVSSNGIIDLEV